MSIKHVETTTTLPAKPTKSWRTAHPHYVTLKTQANEVRFVDKDHGYTLVFRTPEFQ